MYVAMVRYSLQLAVIMTLFMGSSHVALGAEVVVCRKAKKNRAVRCIFKIESETNLRKKDQVIVYSKQKYWVATGRIIMTKKDHFIAAFEPNSQIERGYNAKVRPFGEENVLSYDEVFD